MIAYAKVLTASVLILFSSLGLGRFAFGMILPNMQSSLELSTTQAGFIGSANFVGYFIGIIFTSSLYSKYETYKLIPAALLFQASSLLAMTLCNHYLTVSFFYTFSGFFSALSTISIMVYISHVIPSSMKGKALGVVTMGNGLGIILSGQSVPFIESWFTSHAWQASWVFFALLVLAIALYVIKTLKLHDPKTQHNNTQKAYALFKEFTFWKIAILYWVFGITYVVYVTFFVTASLEKYHVSTYQSGLFWTILGVTSLASGPLFGALSDKIGGYKTLILIYVLQTISMLILVFMLPVQTLYISAFIFGLSAWCIPSIIALLSSIEYDKTRTAQVFSLVSLVFAVGQIIGPVAAGYMRDIFGSFNLVFLACAGLTLFGSLFAFISHKLRAQ